MGNKNKIIIGVTAAVAVLLLAGVVFLFWRGAPAAKKERPGAAKPPATMVEKQGAVGAAETQKLIQDSLNNQGSEPITIRKTVGTTTVEEKAVVVAKGTSPISLQTGDVVTPNGEKTENGVSVNSPVAPRPSYEIGKSSDLPASTIKIQAAFAGFTPAEFTVRANQAVSLAMTSSDGRSHLVKFEDPSLEAIYFSLAPGQTFSMTFNAPAKAGTYVFYGDGERATGAAGKMIVEK